jgi:hypothetical protein
MKNLMRMNGANGAPAVVEGSGRSAAAVVLGLLLVLAARGRA